MENFIEQEFELIEKDVDEFCDDCGHYGKHSGYECEKRQIDLKVTGWFDGEPVVRPVTAEDKIQKALWDNMTPKQKEEVENEAKQLTWERD